MLANADFADLFYQRHLLHQRYLRPVFRLARRTYLAF